MCITTGSIGDFFDDGLTHKIMAKAKVDTIPEDVCQLSIGVLGQANVMGTL
jgi:hypothetical protein